MDLPVFSQVFTVGPFAMIKVPLLKPVASKQPLQKH